MDLEKFNTLKAHIDTILEEQNVTVTEQYEMGNQHRWELDIAPFGFCKLELCFDDHLWFESIPTNNSDIRKFIDGQFCNLLTMLGKVHLDDQFFLNWNYPDDYPIG